VDFLPQKALWLSPKLTLCLVQLQFLPQAQDRKHLAEAPFKNLKNRKKWGPKTIFEHVWSESDVYQISDCWQLLEGFGMSSGL
jgi:hypothetical protein